MVSRELYVPNYRSKRSAGWTSLAYTILYPLLHAFYRIHYGNLDRLEQLKDEPVILAPKHQLYSDIPLEDFAVHKAMGKHAYFVMRDTLPKWFELLGGIGITRGKDFRSKKQPGLETIVEVSDRQLKRDAVQKRKQVDNEIYNLLYRNQLVVYHLEGTRAFNRVSELPMPNVKNVIDMRRSLAPSGKKVKIVPLDIYYTSKKSIRGIVPLPLSSIYIKVGTPIEVDNRYDLAEHLRKEIKLLK